MTDDLKRICALAKILGLELERKSGVFNLCVPIPGSAARGALAYGHPRERLTLDQTERLLRQHEVIQRIKVDAA